MNPIMWDRSCPDCPGCRDAFGHVRTLSPGAVNYVFRCPVCKGRSRVTGRVFGSGHSTASAGHLQNTWLRRRRIRRYLREHPDA